MFALNRKEQKTTKNTQKTSQNLHLQQRFFLLRQKQFLHTGGIPQQYTPGKRKIFLQVRTLRGNACATANVRPSRHSSEKGTPTPGGPSFAVGSQRIKGYYNSDTLQGGGGGRLRRVREWRGLFAVIDFGARMCARVERTKSRLLSQPGRRCTVLN